MRSSDFCRSRRSGDQTLCATDGSSGRVGGRPAERLMRRLGVPQGDDRILRNLRRHRALPGEPLRVVGIDDWSLAEGNQYGTIVVDLERLKIVDVLHDRSAKTMAAWLAEYPTVEIVSRDRRRARLFRNPRLRPSPMIKCSSTPVCRAFDVLRKASRNYQSRHRVSLVKSQWRSFDGVSAAASRRTNSLFVC